MLADQPANGAVDALVASVLEADRPLAQALFGAALPGELDGLTAEDAQEIVGRAKAALAVQQPGAPVITIDAIEGGAGRRRAAIVLANDDMPFLVDSVSAALTAQGLQIHRLLHPVLRDGNTARSLIYIETDRTGARLSRELHDTLGTVLAQVRAAVTDWKAMLAALDAASERLAANPAPVAPHEIAEARAFLDWLADDHFTLLGWRSYDFTGELTGADFALTSAQGLGLLADPGFALWRGAEGYVALPEALRGFMASAQPLLITKGNAVSNVHRRSYFDVVSVKRFDRQGRVIGEDRFLGLFTSAALAASPWEVPILRRKVGEVVDALGFDPRGHTGKALVHVVETFPREELFQVTTERLTTMSLGLLSLLDRPRAKLFIRHDAFGRYVSVLVYVPREAYASHVRERVGKMLEHAFHAHLSRYDVELRAEGLARVHYLLGTVPGTVPEVSEPELDKRLLEIVRGWEEALEEELADDVSATRAARLSLSHGRAFSESYKAQFTPRDAAADIMRLATLHDSRDRAVHLYRREQDAPNQLRLKIYRLDEIIPLSDAVPVLESFGFRVIEEFPFDLAGGDLGWIHDFLLESPDCSSFDLDVLRERVEFALRATLTGKQEGDAFKSLVVVAGLDARQVGWLRAYFRYLRQIGVAYGLLTVVDALRRHAPLTRDLVALFEARFDPSVDDRDTQVAAIDARIAEALAAVSAIDDDRILRLYRSVIMATLRTNAFVPAEPEALAFKLDSKAVPDLPQPVPFREIWVYSPRVEGIHLRGGPIARGGLRWSDRRDDFRTEVLGLVKAQMVKNAVIVPTGAKGGFYPKQLPSSSNRDAWLAEGTEAYRVFIRALLSVTDNLKDGAVVPPAHVVRHDADDPYLVVAADKGTATFSDIANAISVAHDFWLGDAFASGGGNGYDHKAMGITAKGAWISVHRHFREMGIDVQTHPVRVIGVGDMSGDVFGNGMLLSKSLKLVAAFDHRHIFLDPDPDPAESFAERERLFALPRSSWADYDAAKISAGGGIFARTQKSIELSPQVRAMLRTESESMTPSQLLSAILRAPADLIWFGGIGTYVKAASESHADVGDRANDAHRVNAEELCARVIGEGANLGVTQRGRIAFARGGGRINTDFIDNSAGVDCSDNEVNIKIALARPLASGAIEEAARNALLEEMTDDVSALVLRDNVMQTQALSVAEAGGHAMLPAYNRLIHSLEASGKLNRRVEFLPADDVLASRAQAGEGLTRPELAVLLAYTKMSLKEALVTSAVVTDALLGEDLRMAFPPVLVDRFADAIDQHQLRREIIATKLANQIVNRGGITLAFDMAEEHGTSLAHVASCFVAARALFDLRALWRRIDISALPAAAQIRLHHIAGECVRAQLADLLRATRADMLPSAIVEATSGGIARITEHLDTLLRPEPRAHVEHLASELAALGAPDDIAQPLVRVRALDGAVGVALLARDLAAGETAVARSYTLLGEATALDWAKGAAARLNPSDAWERLLLASLLRDFEQQRLDLVRRVTPAGGDPEESVRSWLDANEQPVAQFNATIGRMRSSSSISLPMLAHVAAQARNLFAG